MVNELASTLLQVEEMLTRSVDPNDESPTQRRVSAFAGAAAEPELTFTAEDLFVLVAAGEADYLTQLDLFGRRYAADIRTMHVYSTLKAKLHEVLAEAEDIKFGPDDTVLTRIDAKNAAKLRMQARTLESVIVPLIEALRNDVVLGVYLAEQYGPVMKKYFGDRRVPFFELSEIRKLLPQLPFKVVAPPA